MGNNPNPDTFGMPNSFFTLNEKWPRTRSSICRVGSVLH